MMNGRLSSRGITERSICRPNEPTVATSSTSTCWSVDALVCLPPHGSASASRARREASERRQYAAAKGLDELTLVSAHVVHIDGGKTEPLVFFQPGSVLPEVG